MIKITFCLRRLPHLSHDEFLSYWHERHAPLVRKHQKVLRIARYIQVHTELGGSSDKLRGVRNAPEPFDGVAEIWYESRETLAAVGGDAAARSAARELLEDEKRFIDLPRSPLWTGVEKVII